MKVQVIFYSMYGHVYQLAEAVAEGARQVAGAEVSLLQVPELVPPDVLAKIRRRQGAGRRSRTCPIAEPKQLADADAIIFGTPTRFGNMCGADAQLPRSDRGLWVKGSLIGKVGSVFTSTGDAARRAGDDDHVSFHTTLLHHGMVIVGVPYSCQELMNMNEITGGSPYGASTLAGGDGSRQPSANELAIARFQGKHVAEIAGKLAG